MAKRPTVSTITTGHASITALNNNFTALRDGFDNTLSRDGSSPNTMSADLDLNGNDITNVNTITDSTGTDVVAAVTTLKNQAATSATNAATSATSSATQATNAANSATAAANSATAAANSFDQFDDIYLGAKSSDPSVDNDGDALQTGALYFKTGDGSRVYNGTSWESVALTATEQANLNSVADIIRGTTTYTVTVVGGVFYLDGSANPTLELIEGRTYEFDQSDSSNSGHPLAFKDSGGNAYTTGVTVTNTAGQTDAKVTIVVPTTGTMPARYYCTVHGNSMGNTITTRQNDLILVAGNTANTTIVANNIATIAQKATVDEATALAIALGG